MSQPYKDGPSTCPKCGAPTHYTASGDTESQGYFGTHRYAGAALERPRPAPPSFLGVSDDEAQAVREIVQRQDALGDPYAWHRGIEAFLRLRGGTAGTGAAPRAKLP